MNQILIFRFTAPDQAEWLTPDGVPEAGSLADLAARAGGLRPVLAAPAEAVLLTSARLPGRQRGTWLKAVPFALEDNLAEDVEELHFAVGAPPPGGEVPVAVVRHDDLRGWLAACAEAGMAPAAVVPEPLLLPLAGGAWSLLAEERRVLVRQGPWAGFAADREALEAVLGMALAEAGESPPQALRLWGGDLELSLAAVPVARQDPTLHPLQVFQAGHAAGPVLDLLQGPYSRRAQLGKWLRPWRAAAVLAGVWLGLQGVMQAVEYRQLDQERLALQAQMEQIYRQAVPTARNIVNPRLQLEQRLRELSGGSGGEAGFLDLLYRGGQTLKDFEDVAVRGLRFRNEQLDVDLEGGSLETLDKLKQRLAEQPDLNAQMRTTKREGQVESQLTLGKGAAS